jgi:putative hydrolase of the HAD superfamily
LDDTLYSEKEYVRSGYRAVAKLLSQIDGCEQKLWAAFQAGKPAIDAVLGEAGIVDPAIKEKSLEAYRLQIPQISLYDGVEELMTWVREHGIQIGIITDGRPEGQRRKLEALGLYPMVDSVLITDELGSVRCRKPNDIAYRIMQARFNIPYCQMLYVGDNPAKDFQAPRQLGMRWIYFQNPDGLYSEKTDDLQKVNSVWEMAEMIKRVSE